MSSAMNTNFKLALETVPSISGQFHLLLQLSCTPESGRGSGRPCGAGETRAATRAGAREPEST